MIKRADNKLNWVDAHIGKTIKHWRKEAGYRQEHLAGMLSITRTSICNLELGRQRVSSSTLYAIACIFQKNPGELFPPIKSATIKTDGKERKVITIIATYKPVIIK